MRRVTLVMVAAMLCMPLTSAGDDPDQDCAEPVHTVCANVDGALAGLCELGTHDAVVCRWSIDSTTRLWTEKSLAGYGDIIVYARPEIHYKDGAEDVWGVLLGGHCEWNPPTTGCRFPSQQNDTHVGRTLARDECATGVLDLRVLAYAQPATGVVSTTDAGQIDAVVAHDRMDLLWFGEICA